MNIKIKKGENSLEDGQIKKECVHNAIFAVFGIDYYSYVRFKLWL